MTVKRIAQHAFGFLRQPLSPWAREAALFVLVCIAALIAGFVVSFPGILMWDEHYRMSHSRALLRAFGLLEYQPTDWNYAPLWELLLGLGSYFVFPWLNDELWVRHALTFALLPISLYLTYKLLRQAGVSVSTALLGTASMLAIIRLGGHALFNMKDLPGALAYLLSSLGIWSIVRKGLAKSPSGEYSVWSLCAMGLLGVLPFLTRSPLLLHFVLLELLLVMICLFGARKLDVLTRFSIPLIPLLAGGLFVVLLYPPMWRQAEPLDSSTIITGFLIITLAVFVNTYILWTYWKRWHGLARAIIVLSAGALYVLAIVMNRSELWEMGTEMVTNFRNPYETFSDFSWYGQLTMFSKRIWVSSLPWWYAFGWIPVIAHPLLLTSAAVGYGILLFRRTSAGAACTLQLWGKLSLRLSLERWLWGIVCISFASIVVINPTLYNDERHILFLYPVFFLLGVLGLDVLHRWIKYALTAALIIVSTVSYIQWGRYSYTYVSSIIPAPYRQFTGDYWGVCMSDATSALSGNVPKGAFVRVDGPRHLADMQEARLKNAKALSFDPEYDYRLIGGNSFPSDDLRPFAVMTHTLNSVYYYKRVLQDLENGNAKPILVRKNPFGEAMCILALYPLLDEAETVSEE